ncbi:CPBP family intramembrane glutamic endopeptidase [Clostridium sp. Marseille-Q2269]|uniref:CPBP family intramembrane glutamic endopeptidase n=1 Tax=Clostridium sp. Marseille-Q2269 TaxID=2942205 RepID=UPI0020731BAF|nr:CPBP family intramembrane glutamic endopeptidase [Clostridium sp. Marseille-Q2269]
MKNNNFFKFENKNVDFPFYKDEPSNLTPVASILLFIITIGSVIFYDFAGSIIPGVLAPFINIIIPLGALIIIVKSDWKKLFRKIDGKDLLLVIITVIFLFFCNIILGLLLNKFFGAKPNPLSHIIESSSVYEIILLLAKTIPMLLGEELITIIPFLIILRFGTRILKVSRKKAIIIAWIVTSVIFGAIHLKTYSWNIIQAVFGIGIARIILTYPYIKTKNIWISFLVHLLNDWIIFLPSLLK